MTDLSFNIDNPLSRSTDPITSAQAEAKFKASGLAAKRTRQVLHAICDTPGATSSELANVLHKLYPEMTLQACVKSPSKRAADLAKKGFVERAEKRKCTISDMPAHPWIPTKRGKVAMGYAVGDVDDQQDLF